MPDSFPNVIDAFMCNESAMGIIQVYKLEGNTKFLEPQRVLKLVPGKFSRKRCHPSVLP